MNQSNMKTSENNPILDAFKEMIQIEFMKIQQSMLTRQDNIEQEEKAPNQTDTKKKSKQEKEKYQREIALFALHNGSNVKAAEHYQCHERSVRRYKEKYLTNDDLEQSKNKKQLTFYPKYPILEQQLIEWIVLKRDNKQQVNMKEIQNKALELSKDTQFKASCGWFARFRKRWRISRRTPTHIMQKIGEELYESIQLYFSKLYKYRINMSKQNKQVIFISLDETPVQFNFSKKTYDIQGKKQILVQGVQDPKKRITTLIMVDSLGVIYPPMIIFKGSRNKKHPNQLPEDCITVQNDSAWMTEDFYLLYLQIILGNLQYNKDLYQLCVIHDQFTAHKGIAIEKFFKENNIQSFLIPGGATSLLQVVDVTVNKPFKDRIHENLKSFIEEQQQNNKIQTSISVQNKDYINIIMKSLNQIDTDSIKNGFKTCGVSNNLDHSESKLINKYLQKRDLIIDYIEQLTEQTNNDPYDIDEQSLIGDEIQSTFEPSKETVDLYQTIQKEQNLQIERQTQVNEENIEHQQPIFDQLNKKRQYPELEQLQDDQENKIETQLNKLAFKEEEIKQQNIDQFQSITNKMEVEEQDIQNNQNQMIIEIDIKKENQQQEQNNFLNNIFSYTKNRFQQEFCTIINDFYLQPIEKGDKKQLTIDKFIIKN